MRALILSLLLASACTPMYPTPSGEEVQQPNNTPVDVSPSSASVTVGDAVTFTSSTGGSWSVQEGAVGGSITVGGVYIAPQVAGTYHVVRTATDGRTGIASVSVSAVVTPVTVVVTPSGGNVVGCPGATIQFKATVTGSTNTTVIWSIQESGFGSISSAGIFTVPTAAGTYHVQATSVADPTKVAVSAISVTEPKVLSVVIDKPSVTVPANGTVQFSATVTNSCGSFPSVQQKFSLNGKNYTMISEQGVNSLYELVDGQQVLRAAVRQ